MNTNKKPLLINIVFDTNVLFQDWFLDKPIMLLLEKFINLGDSKLIIPEVVILEILSNYRAKVLELLKEINKLNGLCPSSKKLSHFLYKEEIIQEYNLALTSRLIILGEKDG